MTEPVVAAKAPAKVTLEAGKDYWWCACGLSKKQPFCDGTHKGGSFSPMKYTAEINPSVLETMRRPSWNTIMSAMITVPRSLTG